MSEWDITYSTKTKYAVQEVLTCVYNIKISTLNIKVSG